jgi:hypothetical protein
MMNLNRHLTGAKMTSCLLDKSVRFRHYFNKAKPSCILMEKGSLFPLFSIFPYFPSFI